MINDWKMVLLLCALLGLAPFYPEPHLWGKILWISGGAVGMKPLDWFDFLWHVWPFALLGRIGVLRILEMRKSSGSHFR